MSQVRSFFGSHPLTRGTLHALKVAAATLSAGAATISILTFAQAAGLLNRSHGLVPAASSTGTAAWIGIMPQADTARAIGDTVQLTAALKDEHGALMPGSPSWSSDDPLIASVDSAGTVVVRGEGTTTVVAAAGGRIARARIVVRPQVSAVQVQFDSSFRVPEGERRQAVALPVDARGHPLAGLSTLWRSSDTAVARIDSAGMVAGLTPGRAVLEATVSDIASRIEIAVIPVVGSATVLAGRGQHAPAGRPLASPIVVAVLSRGGRPMDGIPVRFGSEETVLSDAAGHARYAWSMSERPGPQHLAVTVAGLDSALSVTGEADPVAANTRVQLARPVPIGVVGDSLEGPLTVNVTDSAGGPLADVPVSWLALDGGKSIALDARTDSLGHARVTWVLGTGAGAQRLRVQVGDGHAVPALTVNAIARPAAGFAISAEAGAGQEARVASALKKPIAVRVVDRFGNRVPNQKLVLHPEAGSLADSSLASDSAGRVSFRWTLGSTAGVQRLHLKLLESSHELILTARAHPGSPAVVSFVAAPSQGSLGRALAQPVRVVVKDGYGNTLPGLTVQFAPAQGRVSTAQPKTDAHGVATTRWTLGTKPAVQTLSALVKGTTIRSRLEVKGVKAPPAP